MFFSVNKLNVSMESITKQDDVDNWSYLQSVIVPKVLENQRVDLVIGVDVPEALEPEEIIRGQGGGPYAMKTKFGWTLYGPLGRYDKERKHCYLISSCKNDVMLENLFKQYINRDFCESTADSCTEMSMEDKRALAVLDDTAKIVDGHYQFAIPWKDTRPCLPNNGSVAEHRLKHLQKKLQRDVGLCKKYANFVDDLLVNNYARKVPQDQISRNDGVVWYLPHHNVFNPRKPEKVRIVFDCAATYHGKSLSLIMVNNYARKVPQDQISRNDGVVWYLPHHNVFNPRKPEKVRIVFDCAATYHGKSLSLIMVNNYARKVPQDQISRNDGVVWYLPHHNVFNPRKPEKVRIVFDCAATYHGKSLSLIMVNNYARKVPQDQISRNDGVVWYLPHHNVFNPRKPEQVRIVFDCAATYHGKSLSLIMVNNYARKVPQDQISRNDGVVWYLPHHNVFNPRKPEQVRIVFDCAATYHGKSLSLIMVNNYARKVPQDQISRNDGVVWYLPHHNVFNPRKPEKVRIVFDCAATYHGKSLNGNVLQGPDFTNSLVGVLLRSRQESVALMADIESMFHQVRVHPKDIDALRFLWFPHGDLSKDAEEYQILAHFFGGVWLPCCANYALRKTALDNADQFDIQVFKTVHRNFYVDDLLKSRRDIPSAFNMYKEITELLSCGGLHLTKWTSNKREVLEAISYTELSKELKNADLERDTLPTERDLDLQWNIEQDKFQYNIGLNDKSAARRGMLSIVSSVYDPLGFVSPFILRAKMILHQLCRMKLAWDSPVPERELQCWNKWLAELQTLEELSIDRCFKPEAFGEPSEIEIHSFSDACEAGYEAVSYIRMINNKGEVHCAFVIGKSRLTPLKYVTIQRLELSAATVAVKLDQTIRKELEYKITQSFFWTDSKAVLRYIYNENRRFQTFVANRLTVIHDGSDPNQWRYVDTDSNPADDASKGLHANQLSSDSR